MVAIASWAPSRHYPPLATCIPIVSACFRALAIRQWVGVLIDYTLGDLVENGLVTSV